MPGRAVSFLFASGFAIHLIQNDEGHDEADGAEKCHGFEHVDLLGSTV
jgi:hypothetical protein